MYQDQTPPRMQFYEERRPDVVVANSTGLAGFVRAHSFGLIKTNTQASVLVILLIIAVAIASFFFVRSQETVPPTTHYEILPQESVGSPQGQPPAIREYE